MKDILWTKGSKEREKMWLDCDWSKKDREKVFKKYKLIFYRLMNDKDDELRYNGKRGIIGSDFPNDTNFLELALSYFVFTMSQRGTGVFEAMTGNGIQVPLSEEDKKFIDELNLAVQTLAELMDRHPEFKKI